MVVAKSTAAVVPCSQTYGRKRMTTIFRKELRDVLRWTPLGVIVIGLLCWQKIPSDLNGCHNVPSSIASSVIIGSGLFALALGLLQSMFDLRTDARGFLLHRPISARDIFRGKLAAGFVAHTLAWSIPLVLAAIYLESIGPERLPVTWSNIVLPAVCCVVSFLFHPAGMWMACREARWLGTKCLPLVLPVIACVAAIWPLRSFDSSQWQLAIPAGRHRSAGLGHRCRFKTRTDAPDVSASSGIGRIVVVVEHVGLTTASIVATVTVGTFLGLAHDVTVVAESESPSLGDIRRWSTLGDRRDMEVAASLGRRACSPNRSTFDWPRRGNSSFIELTETWREQPVCCARISSDRRSQLRILRIQTAIVHCLERESRFNFSSMNEMASCTFMAR